MWTRSDARGGWRCTALPAAHLITLRGRERQAPPAALVRQVHGARCVRAEEAGSDTCADGLISRDPRRPVAVRTADCLPVLLASADGRCVAAVHAGWRGLVGAGGHAPAAGQPGVLEAACDAGEFVDGVAAIGPSICGGCYEVGEEVAGWFPPELIDRTRARPHVSLAAEARRRLLARGLATVSVLPRCTREEPGLCHSFRRDGRGKGHHVAVIAPRR